MNRSASALVLRRAVTFLFAVWLCLVLARGLQWVTGFDGAATTATFVIFGIAGVGLGAVAASGPEEELPDAQSVRSVALILCAGLIAFVVSRLTA